jgi:hypothetical protein
MPKYKVFVMTTSYEFEVEADDEINAVNYVRTDKLHEKFCYDRPYHIMAQEIDPEEDD